MASQPSSEEIIAAVEQSGYLFEQQVADCLSKHGFHVIPSWPFPDQDEGKSREVDILANIKISTEGEVFSLLWMMCECKNTTHPFVLIGRRDPRSADMKSGTLFDIAGQDSASRWSAICKHLDTNRHHHFAEGAINAVQFCKIVSDRDKWTANHEGVYDSIILPLAKALESHKSMLHKLVVERQLVLNVYYLLVVLPGDIYYLDSSTPERNLRKSPWFTLERRINSSTLSGDFLIDFVNFGALDSFLNDVVEPFRKEASRAIHSWLSRHNK